MKRFQQETIFFNHIQKQNGAALLAVIVSIMVIASIGTAIISATMSSTSLQLGSVDTVSAYFLAESGKHYAQTYIVPEMDNGDDPDTSGTGSMALLNNKTFTLPNDAGQFQLSLSHTNCPGVNCKYTLVANGIPNSKTKRSITYTIEPN